MNADSEKLEKKTISGHLQRWITGIIGVLFLILFVTKGSIPLFTLFVNLVCLISFWEYSRIVFKDRAYGTIPIVGYLAASGVIWAVFVGGYPMAAGVIAFDLILCALMTQFRFKKDPEMVETVFKQLVGVIYVALFLSFIVSVRKGENGVTWFFFLVFIIFAGDIGAYYTGKRWGKHKLCPAVSPGKTIEGAIGGILANIVFGILFKLIFLSALPVVKSVLFFICIGAVGQIGDLFESQLKRLAKMKDSSQILPGHGGLLDRIDALLFALPTAYFFKEFIF